MVKLVPYLTPKQRWGMLFGYITLLAVVTLAGRALAGSDELLVMLLVMSAMFAGAAAFAWWSRRSCPQVPSDELRLRYAADVLSAPLWQVALMYELIFVFPVLVLTVTRDPDIETESLFLTTMIPLGYLVGVALAYSARRRAAKLLRTAD